MEGSPVPVKIGPSRILDPTTARLQSAIVPIGVEEFVLTETAPARRVIKALRNSYRALIGTACIASFHDVSHQLSARDTRCGANDRLLNGQRGAGGGSGCAVPRCAKGKVLAVEKFLKVTDEIEGPDPGYLDDPGGKERIPAGPLRKVR